MSTSQAGWGIPLQQTWKNVLLGWPGACLLCKRCPSLSAHARRCLPSASSGTLRSRQVPSAFPSCPAKLCEEDIFRCAFEENLFAPCLSLAAHSVHSSTGKSIGGQ